MTTSSVVFWRMKGNSSKTPPAATYRIYHPGFELLEDRTVMDFSVGSATFSASNSPNVDGDYLVRTNLAATYGGRPGMAGGLRLGKTVIGNLIAAGGSVLATGVSGLLVPAGAQGLAPTPSMSGGANNYRKGAPIVERIGKGGFWMSGTVRRAGDGAPLAGQRIQIWAHTTEGQEHEPQSHGATLTDKDGKFRLEMPQIIPIFGQPHGHLAYDSGEFKTVFLRPVMRSAKETSLEAHFVLQPA